MPTVPLPDEPSLEQLRNQARDLQRAVRREDPDALAEVADRYPEAVLDDGGDRRVPAERRAAGRRPPLRLRRAGPA